MKGYKGFNKDFKCIDMQYKIGKEFSTDGKLELCENGLHFCKFPLDVIRHYGITTSRFATVESTGMVKDDNPYNISEEDTKVCTNKLKICSEISISGLIDATIKSIKDNIDTSLKDQKILDPKNNINEDASVSANTCNNSTTTALVTAVCLLIQVIIVLPLVQDPVVYPLTQAVKVLQPTLVTLASLAIQDQVVCPLIQATVV